MIRFDEEYNMQEYTIVLSRRSHKHLGQLRNVSEVVSKINMNSANEISFTVYKYNSFEDKEVENLWDEIVDFKYVYVKELDEYYEIKVELNDSDNVCKTVVGTSACECELSQSYIYGLEINTEADIAREEYKNPTIFYKPENPEESLLHRALSKVPHYYIKHVDSSLANIQRTFSADGDDVYSFLTGTVAEEIHCLFVFDTTDRGVSVYDLDTVCLDCGNRGEFSDVCPKCNSTNLKFYGEDTTVFVDTENLAQDIVFTTDTDSIKNCFKLEAGDDNMTAAVTNLNPNGSSYIYYFSDEQKHEMSKELVDKMESYDKLNESYKPEYETVMKNMYEAIDQIVYYTSGMMPTRENEPTDAKKEAAKLTEENLSPTAIPSVKKSTSTATVNSALKNYAKVYVNSGKFKIEVNEGSFSYAGQNEEGYNYGYWHGNFKLTNYGDEEDTAISETIVVTIHDNYKDFIDQKIAKKLAENKDEEGSVFDVLSIKDLEDFKEALNLYCLNRLISFNDAIQGVIDIMIEEGQGKEDSLLYEEFYIPYRNKLEACQAEIDERNATIDIYEKKLEDAQNRKKEIQEILNFEVYLGDELYKEFCCHRREDKYSNENYVSDGLDNEQLFKRAKEFLEEANKELIKSGEHQHSISSTLSNLMAMEEFKPLKDKFKIGNFIRVGVDKNVYRLRLIGYQISFENSTDIDVEFSDVLKIKNGTSDLNSILNKANSMASTYDAIAHQVDKSKESDSVVRDWLERGMDLTNMKIMSTANNQNFVQDKHGLLIRSYDDITESYGDEQMRLVNSTIAITSDSWKTIKTAVGKFNYIDPISGEGKTSYGINAEVIVGSLLIGQGLVIKTLENSFVIDEYGLTINSKSDSDNKQLFRIQKDGINQMYINNDGNIVCNNIIINNANINGAVISENNSVAGFLVTSNALTSNKIGFASSGDIAFWAGSNTASTAPLKIDFNGVITASNANITGVINAKSGTLIGNMKDSTITNSSITNSSITESKLYSSKEVSRSSGTFVDYVDIKGNNNQCIFVVGSRNTQTQQEYKTEIYGEYIKTSLVESKDLKVNTIKCSSYIENDNVLLLKASSGDLSGNFSIDPINKKFKFEKTDSDKWSVELSNCDLSVQGDLNVVGEKNRVVNTSYGKVKMNAVESTDAVFEDYGSGVLDSDGLCTINIDEMFLDTINTTYDYYIYLTPYYNGKETNIYVLSKTLDRFVVCGTPNTKFDWRITAKQKGYENIRMKLAN